MISKWNRSVSMNRLIFIAVFLFLLLCNGLTPPVVDDWCYMFSYADSTRISGVADIFRSMAGHAQKMNGRLVAHGLVQFFLMLPGWIFNVVNALMFTLLAAIIANISCPSREKNNLLAVCVFCAIWVYTPAFGQVMLWLDGACNYLWGVVFGFLFLLPFVNDFIHDKQVKNKGAQIGLVLFSFFAGAYAESASAAFIGMAVLLLVLSVFFLHKKIKLCQILSVVAACLGYITIYLAPAQWDNKSAELTVQTLFNHVVRSLETYETHGTQLMIAFVVLLVMNIVNKTDIKRILLAFVFLAGSLCANFIMVFAVWYPGRAAAAAIVLLITATAVLVPGGFVNKWHRQVTVCLMILLLLSSVKPLVSGMGDIYSTYRGIQRNENYVYACKQEGKKDVSLPIVYPQTKYSALRGLKYLDTEDPGSWPNKSMAKIYGVDSIIGIP